MTTIIYTVESAESAERTESELETEDPQAEVAVAALEGATPDEPENR